MKEAQNNKKTRVVFFVGEFSEGGAERVISILANYMIERNFDIEILKYFNSENLYEVNSKVKINSVEENTKTISLITNLIWMKKHFNKNADIVISFLAPFNILALLTHGKTPIIVADRNDPRFIPHSKFRRVLRDFLYNFADSIVVQTKHNKEYFNKYIQEKTTIIENPIDIKDKVGLALKTKKENLIISVGRLEKQKNQEMMINVFNRIKDDYPNYQLIIYGEGSYRLELEKKIEELGLNNRILLPGNRKNILEEMAKACLYICSSDYEGMSNSLIEAMCIGLPVISTKVSGTEELIINNQNGILIEINDDNALEKYLRELLESKNLQNKIGNEAIKIAEKLKTDAIADRWIKLVDSIIS